MLRNTFVPSLPTITYTAYIACTDYIHYTIYTDCVNKTDHIDDIDDTSKIDDTDDIDDISGRKVKRHYYKESRLGPCGGTPRSTVSVILSAAKGSFIPQPKSMSAIRPTKQSWLESVGIAKISVPRRVSNFRTIRSARHQFRDRPIIPNPSSPACNNSSCARGTAARRSPRAARLPRARCGCGRGAVRGQRRAVCLWWPCASGRH